MKAIKIILITLLVLVILLAVGLQLFLSKGLTSTLNGTVFPTVRKMYGLNMSIETATVSLFGGSAKLEGFTLRNLKGYQEPNLLTFDRCELDIDLMSLLRRDPIVIDLAEADGLVVTVERNEQRKFNVQELAEALKPVESAEEEKAPGPEPEPAPTEEMEPIPVHLRRLAADGTLRLINIEGDNDYTLSLRLTGSDLFTVPKAGQKSSLIVLRGALEHDDDAFVTDLNIILEPLTDPQNPTFTASGSILDIDADFLSDLLRKNDMDSTSFSIKPSINSVGGELSGSKVELILNDLEIYNTAIGDTVLMLPIYGTLRSPRISLTPALQTLFSEQAAKIGKAVGMRELKKELGLDPDAKVSRESLMSGLTNSVKEIEESPALQDLINQVAPGATTNTSSTATNKSTKEAVGDALIEQLEKNVKELEGNEAVRDTLRSLFK